MIDIMIYESGNGGEIKVQGADIVIVDGISNQSYLAHFGGNIEASTTGEEIEGEERFDWWGNSFFPQDPSAQMNSLLERSLNNNSISSQGRSILESDSKSDLEYLNGIASTESSVSIIGVDKIKISDKININQVNYLIDKNEIIEEIIL